MFLEQGKEMQKKKKQKKKTKHSYKNTKHKHVYSVLLPFLNTYVTQNSVVKNKTRCLVARC